MKREDKRAFNSAVWKALSCLLLIAAILCLVACNRIEMNPLANDYLEKIGVFESKILKCDYLGVKGIVPELESVNILDVFQFEADYFSKYYVLEEKESDDLISENDLVQIKAVITEKDKTVLSIEDFILVAAKNGETFPGLQSGIIGKQIGFSGTYLIPETELIGCIGLEGKTLSYTISGIRSCSLESEIMKNSLKVQEINSPAEFYDYLFDLHTRELCQNNKFVARQKYIDAALKQCKFDFSADEVETYATDILKSYQKAASELGMPFEDYWKWARENAIAQEMNEDPYLQVVEEAKQRIGTILWVGAMSQNMGISITDEAVEKALVDLPEEAGESEKATARYYVLEDALIEKCAPVLADSRLNSASYRSPSGDSDSSADITATVLFSGRTKDVVRNDVALIASYLESHPSGALHRSIAGIYLKEKLDLVILLVEPENPAVLEELNLVGLQSEYMIEKGNYGFYRMISLENMIRNSIEMLKTACQNGSADEKMEMLNRMGPIISPYNPEVGKLLVLFDGETSTGKDDSRAQAIELFEEIIGKFEEIEFIFGM